MTSLRISIIFMFFLISSHAYSQPDLQTSSKVIVDDGYDHTEMSVHPWGASHGLFFGAKVAYSGTGNLWEPNNTIFAQGPGQYTYGAFSMGYVAHGGIFGFYDGGLSTGAGNVVTWNPVMSFARGGNIGIGTQTPQAKLAVNGDIWSRKVKVTQNGWPDYVFHNTYHLRPLSEVDQYIQQHHHLPEVPSAAEVEKEGLDLGNNQATLLKKIEELTLYLIAQNKKLEEQIRKNNDQQLEIDVLKKQMQQGKN